MMFVMWYTAQQRQQLKKIDNASNNGISIADDNDDRYDAIAKIRYRNIQQYDYDDDILCWRHNSDIR